MQAKHEDKTPEKKMQSECMLHPLGILLWGLVAPLEKGKLLWNGTPVIGIKIKGFDRLAVAELKLRDDDGLGMKIVVELSPTTQEHLPGTEPTIRRDVGEIVRHFLPSDTSICAPPEDDPCAQFAFLHEGEFVVCVCYTDNNAKGRRKARKEASRIKERQQQLEEKQLALQRKQTALEKEASQRGFPDVASMQAADVKAADAAKTAKQQQREDAKAERDRAERAAEAEKAAKNAEEARKRKAAKEAEKEAERQAKFVNKKGSPPPSSGSSRNTSASPPPPSGGQAGGRR